MILYNCTEWWALANDSEYNEETSREVTCSFTSNIYHWMPSPSRTIIIRVQRNKKILSLGLNSANIKQATGVYNSKHEL
jgi:hypothetical protein